MARQYDLRVVPAPKLTQHVLVKATCDRCGNSAICRGFGATVWASAERRVQGQGGDPPQKYDLCQSCSIEFDEWIRKGVEADG